MLETHFVILRIEFLRSENEFLILENVVFLNITNINIRKYISNIGN